ncbi:hypothetical protein [Leifsonia sp. ALI-44-B]|uniref:hypothetical protein n=1 Tax=Leifsonia sp. ALI-44-B TaxID=1933776 RepID=UPI0015C39AF4|nr:hypothetical protein [Leifsonia sp. ALI-44-B]
MQYELAHRPRIDQPGERITVNAAASGAAVTAARAQIPKGNVLLYVRDLSTDLGG